MNDTLQTMIRSVLKIGGGYFVAKGMADDATAEVIISGVAALIGVVWGYFHRTPPTPPTGTAGKTIGMLFLCGALLSGGVTGCQSENRAAYVATGSVIVTVDAAMSAWGDYVRAGKATRDDQIRVRDIYLKYQAAIAIERDAVLAAQATKDDGALRQALAVVAASQSDVIALVQTLTGKK